MILCDNSVCTCTSNKVQTICKWMRTSKDWKWVKNCVAQENNKVFTFLHFCFCFLTGLHCRGNRFWSALVIFFLMCQALHRWHICRPSQGARNERGIHCNTAHRWSSREKASYDQDNIRQGWGVAASGSSWEG